jgi:hypothetical protein
MHNPFAYCNYVTGDSFCNRRKELTELLRYIKKSQNVLLYSHRKYGKSSLIQQVFREIEEKNLNLGAMHVELYGTISEKDFITRTFQGLNQLESNVEGLLKSIGKALRNFKLNLTLDPVTGGASVSPSFEAVKEEVVLEELMNIFSRCAQKRKLVIAFDEFQEVAGYTEDGFEKRLRSFVQHHSNICYIFSGSRHHLITEMFNSNSRAFYKMAENFPLGKIKTEDYIPWIQNLFVKKNVRLPADFIKDIVERFENHPMYIQNFLFYLWEATGEATGKDPVKNDFSSDIVREIEDAIIERRSLEHSVLWETLSINQKKTLILILQNNGSNLFNADSLKSVNLKTGSLVTKALSSLVKKEIIVKNKVYLIQDIVFKKWLEKTLSINAKGAER